MLKYYPFELHTHTYHSDGNMSPRTLIDKAIERGLVGIALTDHNTTSGIDEAYSYAVEKGLILIKGIEWTTFWGHITVLGGRTKIDWRELNLENAEEIFARVNREGDIVVIAHPKRVGYPVCCGCHFLYKIRDYSNIKGFEVWSNAKPSFNKSNHLALEYYDEILSNGNKLACLYGDDWHDERNNRKMYAKTYLGIRGEVNQDSALLAIIEGRTYISTGIELQYSIKSKGEQINIGDNIRTDKISICVELNKDQEYCDKFNITVDKLVVCGSAIEARQETEIINNLARIEDIKINAGYIRLEIEGSAEAGPCKLLITSPIFNEV